MRNLITLLGGIFILLLSSCTTVRVATDYDRNVSFDQYKSFAFHQKGLDELKMNDLDKRRVVKAISNQLTQKGLSAANNENTADLIINISAKKNTRIDVDTHPWYNPWWGFGPYWGNYDNRIREYKEGTLILDFVDAQNNMLVWQGIGEGLNVSDLENKAERIPKAIEEILSEYPPKK